MWVGVAGPYESRARLQPVNSMRESLGEKAGLTVAKVIEFYIPTNFQKSVKWGPPEQRGKIIEFAPQVKKSA